MLLQFRTFCCGEMRINHLHIFSCWLCCTIGFSFVEELLYPLLPNFYCLLPLSFSDMVFCLQICKYISTPGISPGMIMLFLFLFLFAIYLFETHHLKMAHHNWNLNGPSWILYNIKYKLPTESLFVFLFAIYSFETHRLIWQVTNWDFKWSVSNRL